MTSRTTYRMRTVPIAAGFLLLLFFVRTPETASAFDWKDPLEIGLAYSTHLFLHELGHQVVADQVDAEKTRMDFFTRRDGNFYMGLSTYESIPEESKLPYAVGGEWMSGFTFEYALRSYRSEPTTFNKALMVFSGANFLAYTILSSYVYSDTDNMYVPNLVREETGCSKGLLLSIVTAKTLMNAYRVINQDAKFAPGIWLDKRSAGLMIRVEF